MTAELRLHNGTPTCFLDGKPTFLGYMWCGGPTTEGWDAAEAAKIYAEAGIHLYAFDCGSQGVAEWRGPGEGYEGHFDFSSVEGRLNRILEADGQARFHLRVHLEMEKDRPSGWWVDLHPDEAEVRSTGDRLTQSFASTLWRQQAIGFLHALVAHIESIGMAERVIAYQTGAGGTGEWVKGNTSMGRICGDYSEPMRRHFQAWLRDAYGDDEDRLRRAWKDGEVSFGSAAVPSEAEQINTQHMTFRDPRLERPVIDYYHCLADLCGDLVVDFNHAVKVATQGRALAGAFFGYLTELAWNAAFFGGGRESEYGTTARSGHLGLGRALNSPDVDFIVSPYSYGFRAVGGHGPGMPPSESLRSHGKIYLFEEDSRPHLNDADCGFGRAVTLSDSIAVLRRNMAECLCRGHGIWWLRGGGENPHFDPVLEPAFGPELARLHRLGTFGLELDRAPEAEIAILLDDESYYYTTVRNDLDLPLVFQQRLMGIPRIGAQADYYLLNDFLAGRVPPAKLYIFLNPWHLDGGRREALARELRRDGRVALWIYAPGYLQDEPGLEHMAELTGFEFGLGDNPWGPTMQITDFTHPITQGLSEDLFWGTNANLGPVFYLDDPGAAALGQVVSSLGRCRHGLGVKEFDDWKSVYVAAPNVPAPVLRGIARYAGVHLYSEAGDVLYAIRQLLCVHTLSGGPRTLHLSRTVEVVHDLFENRRVAEGVDTFEVDLPPRSTSLFYTGDAELLKKL